jgi:hypothetical protein
MGDNIVDLTERLEVIEDRRDATELARDNAELARRVDRATETHGRWLVDHAAEMLADAVLAHDGRLSASHDGGQDHIWYQRGVYGEAILEWARRICPPDKPDEGESSE